MWSYVRNAVTRFLGEMPRGGGVGRVRVVREDGGHPVGPGYPTMNSMSAMARFPWVRACVMARAGDLAKLPLRVVRVDDDNGKRTPIPNHPVMNILGRPSSRSTARRLRRQCYTDFQLARNAFFYFAMGIGMPGPVFRLHPALVVPNVDAAGLPVSYTYNGRQTYALDQVLHIADVSWSDDERAVLGESAIRTLHDDLLATMAAKKHAANAAHRGRPEWFLSPMDSASEVDGEVIDELAEEWERKLREGKGAIIMGAALKAQPLSLTMRDLEFSALISQAIDATLAVFDVPPVRVGLPGANYGTAKTQMRNYWESLQSEAALFDDEFSRLTGDPNIRVEHDFTAVEALQVSYSDRLDRVKTWVEMGSSPKRAAEYEGFTAPPLDDDSEPRNSQLRPKAADEVEEPQGTRRSLEDVLVEYFDGAAQRYARAVLRAGGDGTRVHLLSAEVDLLEAELCPLLGQADGEETARAIAQVHHEGVFAHLVECAGEGTEPYVRGLAVFSPFYAAQLGRRSEAA